MYTLSLDTASAAWPCRCFLCLVVHPRLYIHDPGFSSRCIETRGTKATGLADRLAVRHDTATTTATARHRRQYGGRQASGRRPARCRGLREHTAAGRRTGRACRPKSTARRDLGDILTTRHPEQRSQEAAMAQHSRTLRTMHSGGADHHIRVCCASCSRAVCCRSHCLRTDESFHRLLYVYRSACSSTGQLQAGLDKSEHSIRAEAGEVMYIHCRGG